MKPIDEAREKMTAAKARGEHDDFMRHAGKILAVGMKLKKVMLNKLITSARAECPICNKGYLHGRLAGPKNHMRMWCDGEGCDVWMME